MCEDVEKHKYLISNFVRKMKSRARFKKQDAREIVHSVSSSVQENIQKNSGVNLAEDRHMQINYTLKPDSIL